jgi:hypothetical protein
MTVSRRRPDFLWGLLALLLVGSVGIVGLIVWAATQRNGAGFSFADKSAYAKCNGLDKLARQNIGTIPATYRLIDKRYTCRGFRGNTPQRVTQITYTYVADARAPKPKQPLTRYLSAELGRSGWTGPGVATIDGQRTSLHLTREPLVGLSYHAVVRSRVAIFQLVVFARDQWQPPAQDKSAPHEIVVTAATVGKYVAEEASHKPTFVPAGYRGWHRQPYLREDVFDPDSLTSVLFTLTGGKGDVHPEVSLTEAATDESYSEQFRAACGADSCAEVGRNREGRPIYAAGDGNTIYTRLGETFVTIDQLTNRFTRPRVGPEAGLHILDSMQAHP